MLEDPGQSIAKVYNSTDCLREHTLPYVRGNRERNLAIANWNCPDRESNVGKEIDVYRGKSEHEIQRNAVSGIL